jgi:hypothetical protein
VQHGLDRGRGPFQQQAVEHALHVGTLVVRQGRLGIIITLLYLAVHTSEQTPTRSRKPVPIHSTEEQNRQDPWAG